MRPIYQEIGMRESIQKEEILKDYKAYTRYVKNAVISATIAGTVVVSLSPAGSFIVLTLLLLIPASVISHMFW
jgi:hypothetical protein